MTAKIHELPEHVADFRRAKEWRKERGGALFQTDSAFEWFVRGHRDELIGSGQYIVRNGPGGSLVGPHFDAVVLAILRRESTGAWTTPKPSRAPQPDPAA